VDDQQRRESREAIARTMAEVLAKRYPGRFGPEEVGRICQAIGEVTEMSTRLRAYPLTNADEPDPIFRAYRREE
jgi:hypothetical protein